MTLADTIYFLELSHAMPGVPSLLSAQGSGPHNRAPPLPKCNVTFTCRTRTLRDLKQAKGASLERKLHAYNVCQLRSLLPLLGPSTFRNYYTSCGTSWKPGFEKLCISHGSVLADGDDAARSFAQVERDRGSLSGAPSLH